MPVRLAHFPRTIKDQRSRVLLFGFLLLLMAACRHNVTVRGDQTPSKSPKVQAQQPPKPPGESAANPSLPPEPETDFVSPTVPGSDLTISALKQTHVYFAGDNDNKRKIVATVDFPDPKFLFSAVMLTLRLSCPRDRCDAWDRVGALSIAAKNGKKVEIARFITPYGVGAEWNIDVSDLTPILVGRKSMEIFIDTWVGPGHAQGDGWLVDASFQFKSGLRNSVPVAVIPLFEPQSIDYGDPQSPSVRTQKIALPKGNFKAAKIRSIVTGHGQGNSENCAEFCPKSHTVTANGKKETQRIWRADCNRTRTNGAQRGNASSSRAGWCPGAFVTTWDTSVPNPPESLEVIYAPEPYVNSSRSSFNDTSHTKPYYQWSSSIVLYK